MGHSTIFLFLTDPRKLFLKWKIAERVAMLFSMVFNGTKTDSSVVQWGDTKRKKQKECEKGREE